MKISNIQVLLLGAINASQPGNAYGTALARLLEKRLGKEINDAQIYMALSRLEDKGYIYSDPSNTLAPSVKRRGRPRKVYTLTASGRRALESAAEMASHVSSIAQPRKGGDGESKTTGYTPALV